MVENETTPFAGIIPRGEERRRSYEEKEGRKRKKHLFHVE